MKVDVDCQAGRRREDGSVDHKARNFGFSVEEGSLLAIRWFSTAGKPGTTVCGRAVPPPALTDSPDTRLDAGPGVEMQAQDGSVHYYARMTGNPQRRGSLLQVTPQLDVAGDVDFQTGNIDFNGDLVVKGTVRGGFEVKATGDITVGGGLENGALVKSGGTLTVARGIFGEKTRVAASKGIEAQFVQDASLTCEGDITVAKYIFNGKARAAGWVRVPKGGDKGGIAGGEVCARDGIDTSSAGSEHAAQTRLIAGVDLELARSRQKVEQSLEFCRANVQKLMTALRANSSDPQALNQAVARAAPGQRDRARLLARKLEELAGMAVQLEQERESLDAQQLEVARRARIRVEGTLFPKVEIHLGKAARRTAEAVKRVSLALTQDGQIDLSPLT
jgi:uncharacterized protein (DUF342 family)